MLRFGAFLRSLAALLTLAVLTEQCTISEAEPAEVEQSDSSVKQRATFASLGFLDWQSAADGTEIVQARDKASTRLAQFPSLVMQIEKFRQSLGDGCELTSENAWTSSNFLGGPSWMTYQTISDCDEGFGIFALRFPESDSEVPPQLSGIGLQKAFGDIDWEHDKNDLPTVVLAQESLVQEALIVPDSVYEDDPRIAVLSKFAQQQTKRSRTDNSAQRPSNSIVCKNATKAGIAGIVLILATLGFHKLAESGQLDRVLIDIYCGLPFQMLLRAA